MTSNLPNFFVIALLAVEKKILQEISPALHGTQKIFFISYFLRFYNLQKKRKT